MGRSNKAIDWKDHHVDYLKKHFKTTKDQAIADHFKIPNVKGFHVAALRKKLGLMKHNNIVKKTECTGMFNVKANKGNWIV